MKGFGLGLCLGLLLVTGCATSFAYKFYYLNGVDYSSGILVGDTAADDQPFLNCQPTASDAHPCTVLLTATFLQLKEDYLNMANQLDSCQSGATP